MDREILAINESVLLNVVLIQSANYGTQNGFLLSATMTLEVVDMKFPDKFPPGCVFVASFSGDEFVEFPDGSVFKLADSGDELRPVKSLPAKSAAPMSEAAFINCAAGCREFAKRYAEL